MATPIVLPDAFSGMAQDKPRNRMSKGKAWNMVDFIPQQLGASATERGGWSYASPSLTAVDASATYVPVGVYAPFAAGGQLVVIDDHGALIQVVSSVSATAITGSGTNIPKQAPVFLNDKLVIPSADGVAAPQKYNGTAVSALGGTPPNGQFAAIFGGRCYLANVSGNAQRLFASDPFDPETWDTTESWQDVSAPITGLAALPNVLIVFSDDHAARVRGFTPPPQSDQSVDDPIFQYGCTDARSIAVFGSYAVFANPTGVYLTNGTAFPTDLTQAAELKTYWRTLMASYDKSAWTIASGWFGNLVVVSVMNGATFEDCFVFDIKAGTGYRLSNVDAAMLAPAVVGQQELYVMSRKHPRVYKLSTIFTPGASYKNDGDGTAVTGVWESPFYDQSKIQSQRWRDAYLEYDLRDAASDSPTFTLSYITSPESSSYTTLSPTLPAVTKKTTMRRPIRVPSHGIAYKLTRTNAASVADIYQVGATVYGREGSRLN